MRQDELKVNFINERRETRDTIIIENQMEKFKEEHEGDIILNDILLLEEMGYDKKMINKVYILLQPENIERALDYLTEIDGIYQHNYLESNKLKDKGLCFICKKPKRFHFDYIPDDIIENNNQFFLNDLISNEKNDSITLNVNIKDEVNNKICNVCYDDVEMEEIKFNSLPCGHVCCTNCWFNYLKSLISEAKVEKIKCVEHSCKEIISDDFIYKHIKDDNQLLEKYEKFKKRANILNDENKRQCPEPDCDSYLEKDGIKKYVKCEKGHEYCFECLRKPHGNSTCDEFLEKELLIWKKNKRVKRCPKCKIYTEKNEGCNHMTCTNCKYQWCWLCEDKYTYGHYDNGKCKGFQFTVADSLKEAEDKASKFDRYNIWRPLPRRDLPHCCFTLHDIFPCVIKEADVLNIQSCFTRYLYMFLMLTIGFLGFVLFTFFDSTCFDNTNKTLFLAIMLMLIGFSLFICYQIIFTILISPFILISIFYPYFINYIFKFLSMDVCY